jgi:integrase
VKLVKPPEYTSGRRDTWSQAEVRRFLAAAANDRLNAAWRLTLYGLRRGEVLGLRWSDVDLKARTLAVSQSRIVVDYKVYFEPPKTRNGQHTLPLDDALLAALTALRKRLARESEEFASAYEGALPALDWYSAGDKYVVVDELGTPVHPEW